MIKVLYQNSYLVKDYYHKTYGNNPFYIQSFFIIIRILYFSSFLYFLKLFHFMDYKLKLEVLYLEKQLKLYNYN